MIINNNDSDVGGMAGEKTVLGTRLKCVLLLLAAREKQSIFPQIRNLMVVL